MDTMVPDGMVVQNMDTMVPDGMVVQYQLQVR